MILPPKPAWKDIVDSEIDCKTTEAAKQQKILISEPGNDELDDDENVPWLHGSSNIKFTKNAVIHVDGDLNAKSSFFKDILADTNEATSVVKSKTQDDSGNNDLDIDSDREDFDASTTNWSFDWGAEQ